MWWMTRRAPLRYVVGVMMSTGTHVVDDAASTGTGCDAVASMVLFVLDDDDVAMTALLTRTWIFHVIPCAFRINSWV